MGAMRDNGPIPKKFNTRVMVYKKEYVLNFIQIPTYLNDLCTFRGMFVWG